MTTAVSILTTGGTIASTAGAAGAVPTHSGTELVADASVPDGDVEVSVEQVSQALSFTIEPSDVATLGRRVRTVQDSGCDGVVVTHGTDTMAVAAYYLDVALDPDVPVVFTGAQRRPDEQSADGPANLQTAVAAASHDAVRAGGGVYVAFNEELHAARDVRKTHTHKLESFRSPGTGPVAVFDLADTRLHREPRSRSVHVPVLETDATVDVVRSGIGVTGDQLRGRLDDVDGVVLEGTGLGNVTPDLAEAVDAARARDVPVVLTSRCHAGPVRGVYGTDGGGKQLLERGVIPAGDLPSSKARVKLMLALERDPRPSAVAQYFPAGPAASEQD